MTPFITLALIFIGAFLIGYFLERLRVPWVFGALIVGMVVSAWGGVVGTLESAGFDVIAHLGMLLLLFLIGLEIDVREFLRTSKILVKSVLIIIPLGAVLGGVLIHFLFGYPWYVALLVALSFETVGEAVLVPILEEFGMVNTKLGRFIIGVGTLDDAFELVTIILATALVGRSVGVSGQMIGLHLLALLGLILLTASVKLLKRIHLRTRHEQLGAALPIALFFLFVYAAIGELAEMDALAAILAGVALRMFLPGGAERRLLEEVRAITYGFFAPVFFFWVGAHVDLTALFQNIWLVGAVTLVSALAKIVGSVFAAGNYLGKKQAAIAGIGLCVRFSTSIVIVKMLYDYGIIGATLFSVLVATTALFTFTVPFAFAVLLSKHVRPRHSRV